MNLSMTEWLGVLVVVLLALSVAVPWALKRFAVKTVSGLTVKPVTGGPQLEPNEAKAHEVYTCLRVVLTQVKDCPNATAALHYIVLPAVVTGQDPPHYNVAWQSEINQKVTGGSPATPDAPCP